MINSRYLVLPLLCCLFSACESHKAEDQIAGTWVATQILEDGTAMPIDPKEVQFQFSSTGKYTFRSTLNYQESGTYYIEGNILYAMDTTHAASFERTVKLEHLSTDSLVVEMQESGKTRKMHLLPAGQ